MLTTRKAINYTLVLIVVLLGTISFGLCRLSAMKPQNASIIECNPALSTITEISGNPSELSTNQKGQYVASVNGSVYHFPWCSGAKQISEQNLIWFATKVEAQEAGYRPAANCKGL